MPDKQVSHAKCHICGQKVPFTNGNPNELIEHMLVYHDQETTQHFNCLNKTKKPKSRGEKRQAAGKNTLLNYPKRATCVPQKCKCKSNCPNPKKTTTSDKNTPVNLGSFKTPLKLRIRCKPLKPNEKKSNICEVNNDMNSPSRLKNEIPKETETCKSSLAKTSRCTSAEKKQIPSPLHPFDRKCNCGAKRKTSTEKNKKIRFAVYKPRGNRITEEMKRLSGSMSPTNKSECYNATCTNKSPFEICKNTIMEETNRKSLPIIDKCIKCIADKSRKSSKAGCSNPSQPQANKSNSISPEKNKSLPCSVICNKNNYFVNKCSCEPQHKNQHVTQYSSSNLKKRKGSKEMYKTTLETWTAGSGHINCPKCRKKVVPLIRKQKNRIAFTSVGASLLLTCWPFCFLIPMMYNSSVDLYCPSCKHKLGVYNSSTGKTTSMCVNAKK